MDRNFQVQAKTAAFRHYGERHTGINIAAAFEEVLAEYGIASNSFGYQVTNNASNMLKAFDLFSMHAHPSAAQVNHDGNQNIDPVDEGDSEEDSDFVTKELQYDDLFVSDNSNLEEKENAGLSESQPFDFLE